LIQVDINQCLHTQCSVSNSQVQLISKQIKLLEISSGRNIKILKGYHWFDWKKKLSTKETRGTELKRIDTANNAF